MKQAAKRDKHSEFVEQRARKSATYHKTVVRTLHQINLALLVREREGKERQEWLEG